jgi:hypothetical protein
MADVIRSETNPAFSEVQRFRQVWVIILVGFIALLSWAFLVELLFNPANGSSAVIIIMVFVVFGVVFPVWFLVMKLEIKVGDLLLSYRMYPLQVRWREVPAGEIASAEAVTYRPILEYGGWGIRIGCRGWAYNVSGNRGVFIRKKTGNCFLLGSQKPDELAAAIHHAMDGARGNA